MADEALRELLAAVLSRVVPDAPPAGSHDALSGGIGQRSYRIAAGERQYVVRLRQPSAGNVLDPAAECELMRLVASAGLAPGVLGADRETGAIVTEYREHASPWSPSVARETDNIERAAELLKSLHRLRVGVHPYEPRRFARSYIDAGDGVTALDDTDRRLADELSDLAGEYEQRYEPAVLCHNDLVAPNILDEANRLILVDFEYAVLGAPVLDLASIAAMNDFDSRQRRTLLDAYYADAPVPFTETEFVRVVRMLRLMAYFWALAAQRTAPDPSRYSGFTVRADLE